MKEFEIFGMAHITGGGFEGNIPRTLPEGVGVEIDTQSWQVPAIFQHIQTAGKIHIEEMYKTTPRVASQK